MAHLMTQEQAAQAAYDTHVRQCVMRLRVLPMTKDSFMRLRQERDSLTPMTCAADGTTVKLDVNLQTGETFKNIGLTRRYG